jgi:hypothetical protein
MISLFIINVKKHELTVNEAIVLEKRICDDLYERVTSVSMQPNLNTTYRFSENISVTANSDVLVIEDGVTYFCYLPINISNGTSRDFMITSPVNVWNQNNEVIVR